MERNKIPQDKQEKFVILYDTAKKCLLILDKLYGDLANATLDATDTAKITADSSTVINIYVSAFGLIDYLHRFHELVCAMPLLRQNQPELKKLTAEFKPICVCRNYIQHMRTELATTPSPLNIPILGAISWIHGDRNYTLFTKQPLPGQSARGIVYDRLAEKYICKYLLNIGGHEVQLDIVYTQAKSFWEWLEKIAVIDPPQIKDYTWGKPFLISSKFTKT